jgi:predicted GH43/DUF377 family glycosyl hydrolase
MAHGTTTSNGSLRITRRPERFVSDDSRVIARFFDLGEARTRIVIDRVLALDEETVNTLVKRMLDSFSPRHRHLERILERHFAEVSRFVQSPHELTHQRRMLIGAYFTMEYSIESAALFNPSMVPHFDQSGCKAGELRFLMSLRATGEGHVSSIVFRTGKIHRDGHIDFDPVSKYATKMRQIPDRLYEKKLFFLKLIEMGAYTDVARVILTELPDTFTLSKLEQTIQAVRERPNRPSPISETAENMLWLARSNYHLELPTDAEPADVVIFPTSENESRGIEDCRLTRFSEDDGTTRYFGTYTAYNGFRILPQIIETRDFTTLEVHTLNGRYVQNKGMALFPRKIDGDYYMISRIDGENMFIMRSDNVYFWNECEKLQCPRYPWEFVQIGNCGPPLETDAGWLVLTHGVGPFRQYCIGAILLDRDNPSKVVGHLENPLLVPEEDERDGYVPNVVYSCGGLIHNDTLVLPYAVSDSATTFATLCVSDLIAHLTRKARNPPPLVTA